MLGDPGILCRGLDVRGDETCNDAGDIVPRDADVFQLPVVEATKRSGGLAAVPALHHAGGQTCHGPSETGTKNRCGAGY